MDAKTLDLLDYTRIQSEIAFFCVSELGKRRVLTRQPFTDAKKIIQKKALCREIMHCSNSRQGFTLKSFQDCTDIFNILRVEGASLSIEEMCDLADFCLATQHFVSQVSVLQKDFDIQQLQAIAKNIPSSSDALTLITEVVDLKARDIKDLPEIKAIKKSIRSIQSDIQKIIKKYTTDASLAHILQSDVPTISGDRQVIAVKANFQGRIKGIVHKVSQSGQTLYLEPELVVQKNNELLQEENRLHSTIRRILRDLTSSLLPFYDNFCDAYEIMVDLDTVFCGVRWGIEHNATLILNPTPKDKNKIILLQACHPLLKSKAIPIDIKFFDSKKVLIITGPNAGGKTVSLKTLALFAALNQTAIPLPCSDESVLPFFDAIFADIGDDQSLDNSLSTFSAHVKHLATITSEATENSLVLLDELGSGTDPQEGGALAMALLDFFLEKKSTVMLTTHQGCLKNYGYTHDACMNASVDFDNSSLLPTYRIIMGVPGESHAFDIAMQNNLPQTIIEKARSYIVNEQVDISTLITGLTNKYKEITQLEELLRERERSLLQKDDRLNQKELKLQELDLSLHGSSVNQYNRLLHESRSKLENLVRELREGEITREKTQKVKAFIKAEQEIFENEGIIIEEKTQNVLEKK
ncbi:MAG: endonuclease MutS2, partial [Treponemataceae bacterium]